MTVENEDGCFIAVSVHQRTICPLFEPCLVNIQAFARALRMSLFTYCRSVQTAS